MRHYISSGTLIAIAILVSGQQAAAQPRLLPTAEQQIATAVLALPKEMREGATVMGYRSADKLETLREGKNGMNCLALFAVEPNFHIACYHNGMEPFMARGRALRAEGVKGAQVDSVRFREARSGALVMPKSAAMYQIFGDKATWNATTGKLVDARTLMVMYIPNATVESSGLSPVSSERTPWIMFPGTPKAHMMLSGSMGP